MLKASYRSEEENCGTHSLERSSGNELKTAMGMQLEGRAYVAVCDADNLPFDQ